VEEEGQRLPIRIKRCDNRRRFSFP